MDELIKYLAGSSTENEAKELRCELATSESVAAEYVNSLAVLTTVDLALAIDKSLPNGTDDERQCETLEGARK